MALLALLIVVVTMHAQPTTNAPVGLDIGSKTPPEIAVAIAASLIELRNRPHARPEQAPPE